MRKRAASGKSTSCWRLSFWLFSIGFRIITALFHMKNFREKMVKKIRDTAERQRIALSEEDEAILNWGVTPVAAEATEDEDSDDGLVNEANTPENAFTPEESEPQEDAEIGRPFFFN